MSKYPKFFFLPNCISSKLIELLEISNIILNDAKTGSSRVLRFFFFFFNNKLIRVIKVILSLLKSNSYIKKKSELDLPKRYYHVS